MYRLRRFGVIQTANMAAMMYFVMSIIVFLPFILLVGMLPDEMSGETSMFSGIMLFLLPPLYAALGWVATAIACWLYNIIAGFVGGIAVELEGEA